jgi:hypothetical protein
LKNILARGGIEFLAVLLGISLSLWVEDWRQNNEIASRLNLDYLNIKQEINEDIDNINNIISKVENQILALNNLVDYYEGKTIFDKDDLSNNLGTITAPTFYGTKTAYSASVSSGRLNFSKDMNLTNEITLLYEHYYKRLDSNSEIYDIRNSKLKSDYFMPFYSVTVGKNEFSDKHKEIFYSSELGNSLYWILEFVENYYIKRLEDTKEQMLKTEALITKNLITAN